MHIRIAAAVLAVALVVPCYALTPEAKSSRVALNADQRAKLAYSRAVAPVSPPPVNVNSRGEIYLQTVPELQTTTGRIVGKSRKGESILYTIDPQLHELAKKLVAKANAPHLAVVAMEPSTGRVLAMAEKSQTLQHPLLHARFPAASLFKIITAAAALETNTIQPLSVVNYRGGTYTLNRWNYTVDPRQDRRKMSFAEAIGKSCNPVFARVALKHLVPSRLRVYADRFGFNSDLKFDIPLQESVARVPGDNYEFSRTAAGFGDVSISPIHAAALMAAVANRGLLPRPRLVDKVVAADGTVRYSARTEYLRRAVHPDTAEQLMGMLEYTTTSGTSRNEFFVGKRQLLPNVRVAGKTGTLRGTQPLGLNKWFIGAAPFEKPRIVVAVIAVNPLSSSARPSHIGRLLIQEYLDVAPAPAPAAAPLKASYKRPVKPARKPAPRPKPKKAPSKQSRKR